ncbi:zinc finger protein 436-like isoform X1 [Cheilinus undulatus]|uniref:zinc finger protein 436-like isoform X1 n=1 Tax=Cheilinus undulatus TaxID=241271 RepID=UPI001BD3DA4B|nr:zinc finger protein 436-like isoform X1 [Cheilinus undulatus]
MSGFKDSPSAFRDLGGLATRAEEELHRRNLLDVVLNPKVKVKTAVIPAAAQLLVSEEQNPQQYTETPLIKEEQEELWSSQEGEHLQGLKVADNTMFPFNIVYVKSEDDEEKPQSPQLHNRQSEQMESRAVGEDCGAAEPARNPDPEAQLQPEIEVKIEDSSGAETDNNDGCRENKENPSGSNSVEEKSLSCPECGITCKDITELTIHTRIHTGEKNFNCSICSKTFTRKGQLTKHNLVHTGERPFSCSECGKTFKRKHHLTDHKRLHTGEKPFSCSECGRTFNWRHHLTDHMRFHTGEKPFSCSECGKTFQKKQSLTHHMRTHTGEKLFRCPFCLKTFTQKSNMDAHVRVHMDDKPFSCSECGKSFQSNKDLNRHTRIHTGEKPFTCSECGKEFNEKENQIRHMKVHTEEKPFCCSLCSKRFKHNFHLLLHMAHHRGEKPYSCSECKRSFAWHCQIKRHKCVRAQGSEPDQNQTEERREAETGADGEDWVGAGPAWSSDPERYLQPETEVRNEDSSEDETDNRDDWRETRELHSVLPAYDQQLLVSKEECLQEDSGPPHIKEEQEELWSSPEKEELQGLKEADTTKFPFKIVIVKSEDDEERPCPHSFMRDKVKRWKQELIERAVEEQNQLIEFN